MAAELSCPTSSASLNSPYYTLELHDLRFSRIPTPKPLCPGYSISLPACLSQIAGAPTKLVPPNAKNPRSDTSHSIFASKPFTFIVQGKPLQVHAALISDCSEPLDRMINGQMSEAQQGFALLEDVDEGTFVRFIRWAYSKDYPAAEYTLAEVEDETSTQASKSETSKETVVVIEDLDDAWGSFGTRKDKKKKKHSSSSKGSLKESFISQYESSWGTFPAYSLPTPRSNKSPLEDYTEVFLGHARMYVFAEKYDIQSLKKLALDKLQHTLSIFTLYPERVGDITALLRYVYANTTETVDGTNDVRTMLAHYIGTEMETLIKDGEIKDLMLEDGEMLSDFLRMFALRVN